MLIRNPTHRRRPLRPLLEPIEPRLLLTTTPATTTTLTASAPLLNYTQSVTLTATVTTADNAHTPVPTGTVAFIEPLPAPTNSLNRPTGRFPNVIFQDPTTHAYQLVQLIGTAPLASDGTASLPLSSLDLSTHAAQAVFLGSTPIISTTDCSLITPDTYPSYVSAFGVPTGTTLFLTNGKYLAISPDTTTNLDADFTDYVPYNTTPVTPGPDGLSYHDLRQSFYMSSLVLTPSDTPYLIVDTPWTTQDYSYRWGTYTTTHHSLSVTPFTGLAPLPDQNDAYQTSLSTGLTLAPNQPTTLHLSTSGPFTYTNPPAITVSLSAPDGTSYSRHAPNPAPRGDYNRAHAGLDVQVSTPSGGGPLSGSTTFGGGYHQPPFVPSGPFPTGTVSFFDEHNTLLATLPLDSDGNATFYPDPRSLSLADSHTIHAVYSGDASYQSADATTSPFTLTHTPTSAYLDGLPSSIYSNSTLHLQGVVYTSVRDTVTPTGTLTFSVDGQTLASLPALPGAPSTSDPASSPISLVLSAGDHTITLSYSGDPDCLPSSHSYTVHVLEGTALPLPNNPYHPLSPDHITDASLANVRADFAFNPTTRHLPGDPLRLVADTYFTGTGMPLPPNPLVSFALSADDVAGNADDIPLPATLFDPSNRFLSLVFGPDGYVDRSTSFNATLPADLAPGDYHLVATIDPANVLAESSESNNTIVSTSTITLSDLSTTPPTIDPYHPSLPSLPDLKGSITTSHPTTSPNAPAALTLTLTNRKSKALHRNYKVLYYLSTDRTLSPDDTRFSKQTIHASLAKKESRSYTLHYKLPKSAPLGTRYLIAVADTPTHTPSARLVLASKKPLKIAVPHLSAKIASTEALSHHKTRLTLRLTNPGPTPFAGPVKLRLTSTTNPLLRTLRRTLSLAPHTSTTLTVTLPTRLLPDPSALSVTLL